MSRDEIKQTIDEFLSLVENGCGSPEKNENRHKFLLDKLAFAQHFAKFEFDSKDYPDAPRREHKEMMNLVGTRFPSCRGDYYTVLNPVNNVGVDKPEYGIGWTADDLADIAHDLSETKWRWENNSPEDGLWFFTFSFESHWAEHLRNFQIYLIELKHRT